MIVIAFVVGLVIGGLGVFAWQSRAHSNLEAKLARAESGALTQIQVLESLKAASAAAMETSSSVIVGLADSKMKESAATVEGLVKPVAVQLKAMQERLEAVERERVADSSSVKTLVDELKTTTMNLLSETHSLSSSMRDSRARGRWGEQQLERIVELAGMLEHCDYDTQVHIPGTEGASRPDMIVRLPQDRLIVIDAKAPLTAYLDGLTNAATPEAESAALQAHSKAMSGHVNELAKKNYTDQVKNAIDFVVMFIPGDAFLAAAMRTNPDLFEQAAAKGVVITTPSTLLALLKAISFGWRQTALAEHAHEIEKLGSELLKRLGVFAEHFNSVGESLGKSVQSWNKAVGSIEVSFLPSARRMNDLGLRSEKTLPSFLTLEAPRQVTAPELVASIDKDGLEELGD